MLDTYRLLRLSCHEQFNRALLSRTRSKVGALASGKSAFRLSLLSRPTMGHGQQSPCQPLLRKATPPHVSETSAPQAQLQVKDTTPTIIYAILMAEV